MLSLTHLAHRDTFGGTLRFGTPRGIAASVRRTRAYVPAEGGRARLYLSPRCGNAHKKYRKPTPSLNTQGRSRSPHSFSLPRQPLRTCGTIPAPNWNFVWNIGGRVCFAIMDTHRCKYKLDIDTHQCQALFVSDVAMLHTGGFRKQGTLI